MFCLPARVQQKHGKSQHKLDHQTPMFRSSENITEKTRGGGGVNPTENVGQISPFPHVGLKKIFKTTWVCEPLLLG